MIGCGVEELLIPEPGKIGWVAGEQHDEQAVASPQAGSAVTPPAPGRALAPARLMAARIRAATPVGSCPDCLSWGASYGSQSYCRACYDFTRRYDRGECARWQWCSPATSPET